MRNENIFQAMVFGEILRERIRKEKTAEELAPERLGDKTDRSQQSRRRWEGTRVNESGARGRQCFEKERNDRFGQMCYIEHMAETWKDVTKYRNVVNAEYKNDGTEEASGVLLGAHRVQRVSFKPCCRLKRDCLPIRFLSSLKAEICHIHFCIPRA